MVQRPPFHLLDTSLQSIVLCLELGLLLDEGFFLLPESLLDRPHHLWRCLLILLVLVLGPEAVYAHL